MCSTLRSSYWLISGTKARREDLDWSLHGACARRTVLDMEIAQSIYLYLVQKYPQGYLKCLF